MQPGTKPKSWGQIVSMRKDHLHICLWQPEIPQNTGSIARMCAATLNRLHLVRPFGFSVDDRNLKRAGLDYWPFLDVEIHDSIELVLNQFDNEVAFLSRHAEVSYTKIPATTRLLVFGRETSGLPRSILAQEAKHCYSIPMFHPGVRSLNLSNAATVVTYSLMASRGLLS